MSSRFTSKGPNAPKSSGRKGWGAPPPASSAPPPPGYFNGNSGPTTSSGLAAPNKKGGAYCPLSEGEFLDRTGGVAPYFFPLRHPRASSDAAQNYFSSLVRNFLKPDHIEHDKFMLIVEKHRIYEHLCAEELTPSGRLRDALPIIEANKAVLAPFLNTQQSVPTPTATVLAPGEAYGFMDMLKESLEKELSNGPETTAALQAGLNGINYAANLGMPQDSLFGIRKSLGTASANKKHIVERVLSEILKDDIDVKDEGEEGLDSDVASPASANEVNGDDTSTVEMSAKNPDPHLKVLSRGIKAGGSVANRVSFFSTSETVTEYLKSATYPLPAPSSQNSQQDSTEAACEKAEEKSSSFGVDIHTKVLRHQAVWMSSQQFPKQVVPPQPHAKPTPIPPKKEEVRVEPSEPAAVAPPAPTAVESTPPPPPALSEDEKDAMREAMQPVWKEHESLCRIAKLQECAAILDANVQKLLQHPKMRLLATITQLKKEYGVTDNSKLQKDIDRRVGRLRQESGGEMETLVWQRAIPKVITDSLLRDPVVKSMVPPTTTTVENDMPSLADLGAPAKKKKEAPTKAPNYLEEWLYRCINMDLTPEEQREVNALPNYEANQEHVLRTAKEQMSHFHEATDDHHTISEEAIRQLKRYADFKLFCTYIARRPFFVFVAENVAVRIARMKKDKKTDQIGVYWSEEGELDGVLYEAVGGNVVKIFEIKRNPADLTHAMKQRDRFTELLHDCIVALKKKEEEEEAAADAAGNMDDDPEPAATGSPASTDEKTSKSKKDKKKEKRNTRGGSSVSRSSSAISSEPQGLRFALKPTPTTPAYIYTIFPTEGASTLNANFGTVAQSEANWIVVTQKRDVNGELPIPAKTKFAIIMGLGDAFAKYMLKAKVLQPRRERSSSGETTEEAALYSMPLIRNTMNGTCGAVLVDVDGARSMSGRCHSLIHKAEKYTPSQLYWLLLENNLLHNVVWIELPPKEERKEIMAAIAASGSDAPK